MSEIVAVMRAVCREVIANRDHLGDLDAALGDGDHGVSMAKTFAAVDGCLDDLEDASPSDVLDTVGTTILTSVGGAMGPLFGTAFKAAADSVKTVPPTSADVASAIVSARDAVADLGGARVGDKTMLDALDAAAGSAREAAAAGSSIASVVTAAAEGAERGALATTEMRATVGRASRLGDRSVGTPDPGATSVAIILRAAAVASSTHAAKTTIDERADLTAEGGSQ